MGKILKTALTVVGAVAGFIVAGPEGAFIGASLGGAVGSLLSPKPKTPDVSSAVASRPQVSINLRAPRTIVFGRTAMNTDLRDEEYSSDQQYLHRFIVVASHKVTSIEEVWFDDKQAWTSAGGTQWEFVGYLDIDAILEGSAANAINISARMGASRRYTGCAYIHVRYKLTGNSKKTDSPFAQSVPTRVTIIGKGAAVYDPRKDSTAGGSGSQRANDQTTWAWDDDASRNPVIQALWYELGWRIQNPVTSAWKLAAGKGIPPARLNLASYIDAANLCDETVAKAAGGTEPRYRSDGVFNEGDDPSTVRDSLKAACNALLDDIDGKIRISVLHNDLASPIGDLGTADVLGDFSWIQTPPLDQSVNIIRGGYTDPSTTSLYQLADYPEVSFASPDGIDRPQTVNLPMVQSPSQAQRLIKLRLQRAVFGGTFEAVYQATAWRFQKGDVIRFTFAPLGWTDKLMRIADITVRVDGTVPMVLREEDAALYPATATDAAPVVGVAATHYDAQLGPIISAINDAVAASNGYSQAQLRLYKRATSAPAVPTATLTYTFATDALTGSLAGWSRTPPAADGNPLYVIVASAVSNTATDTVATGEWSASVIEVQDGGTGTNGLNVATVFLYKRGTSAPAVPSTTTAFTFSSGVLTGTLSGWTQSLPSGTDPVYFTTATAVNAGSTDTIATGEWATPQILAQNGSDGTTPTTVTLDKAVVSVAADATNATKAGSLPKNIKILVDKGGVDLTSTATVGLSTSSAAIVASYSYGSGVGTISATQADTEGKVFVTTTIGGVQIGPVLEISITRPQDPLPPQSTTEVAEDFVSGSDPGTSYANQGDTMILKANGSGQIKWDVGLDYTVFNFGSGGKSGTYQITMAWRIPGGSWSYPTGITGSNAVAGPFDQGDGAAAGGGTISSLSAGAAYELQPAVRRSAGLGGSTFSMQGQGHVYQ